MSAPSVKRSGVGFRGCTIFPLNASGYLNASGATAYEGITVEANKVLTINDPEYRRISHVGDDRVLQLDQLPPEEAATAELRVGRLNDTLEAALTGLLSFTVAEGKLFLSGVTDKDGFEPTVGLLAYRQALDDSGNRVWEARIMPKVIASVRESGFDNNPEERMYTITPQLVTKHIWGTSFVLGTEGGLQAQIIRGVFQYKPKIVAFVGDNTEDEFLFPANAQAAATGKIAVWLDGVLRTANLTKATTGLTFTSAVPGAGVNVTVLYETA